MTVPTYDKLMLPLLQFSGDGKEHHIREAITAIADYLNLNEDERNELLPSGKKRKFDDRVQWAKTYIKKAGLIDSTGRGLFQITQRGLDVLATEPTVLDRKYLTQFDEFVEFVTPNTSSESSSTEKTLQADDDDNLTPKELIESVFLGIRKELTDELLEYVLSASPAFFEKLVVDLLLAMGYGGALSNAGERIGRSGDGGLDGYIKEDKLGLDMIYLQAKRWATDNTVGRPDIQGFVGSLMGAGASKGVFITTSKFSKGAVEYAESMQNLKVILIDGEMLTRLMIEHDVGVSIEKNYVIKRVDTDYFDLG